MPSTDTITIYRGEAVVLNFAMSPVEDITSWEILFTVKDTNISATATITGGAEGEFSVALTADETELRPGTYTYDAWRVDIGSEVPLAVGLFVVNSTART